MIKPKSLDRHKRKGTFLKGNRAAEKAPGGFDARTDLAHTSTQQADWLEASAAEGLRLSDWIRRTLDLEAKLVRRRPLPRPKAS